uniref:uncharacterized protein LOC120333843 n=1 Tax=Styela clava TaxID=7725 RepID=UPI001939A0E6|nr:uncharacterized protein LOC120333843 [Styela clava]
MIFENLEFRILQEGDFNAVWNLILAEYITREPCCVALDLDEEKISTVYLNLAKNSISHQASLGAFDKQTKELIGINLTLLAKKRDSIPDIDLSQLPKEMQQYGMMLTTLSGEENLVAPEKFMGTKNYMQSTMLCSKTGVTRVLEQSYTRGRKK